MSEASQPLTKSECARVREALQNGARLSLDDSKDILNRFQEWFVHNRSAHSDQFTELAFAAGFKSERSARDLLLQKMKDGSIGSCNWKIVDNVPPDHHTTYTFNFRGFTQFIVCAGTDVARAFRAHVNESYHENAVLTSALAGNLPVQVSVGTSTAGQLVSCATLLSTDVTDSNTKTIAVPPASTASTTPAAVFQNPVFELVRTHSRLAEGVLLRVVEEARLLEAHQSEKIAAQCKVEETRLKEENRKREIEQKAAEAVLREENRKREIEENARIEKMKEDAKTERKRIAEETKRNIGEKRLREETLLEEVRKIPKLITDQLQQALKGVSPPTSPRTPDDAAATTGTNLDAEDPQHYIVLRGELSAEHKTRISPYVGFYVMVLVCPPDGGILFVPKPGSRYLPTKVYGGKHYRQSVQVIMKRLAALVLPENLSEYTAGELFNLKLTESGMDAVRLRRGVNDVLLHDDVALAAIERVRGEKSRVAGLLAAGSGN